MKPAIPPKPTNLVYCTECGKQVARTATVCPHCGAPQKRNKTSSIWKWLGVGFFVLVCMFLIGTYMVYQQNKQATPLAVDSQNDVPATLVAPDAPQPNQQAATASQAPQGQPIQGAATSSSAPAANGPCEVKPENSKELASLKTMVVTSAQPRAYFFSAPDQNPASKKAAFVVTGDQILVDPAKTPNRNGFVCGYYLPEQSGEGVKGTLGWLPANQLSDVSAGATDDLRGAWLNGDKHGYAIQSSNEAGGQIGLVIIGQWKLSDEEKASMPAEATPYQMDSLIWHASQVPQSGILALTLPDAGGDDSPQQIAPVSQAISPEEWDRHSQLGVCAVAMRKVGNYLNVMEVPSCSPTTGQNFSGIFIRGKG